MKFLGVSGDRTRFPYRINLNLHKSTKNYTHQYEILTKYNNNNSHQAIHTPNPQLSTTHTQTQPIATTYPVTHSHISSPQHKHTHTHTHTHTIHQCSYGNPSYKASIPLQLTHNSTSKLWSIAPCGGGGGGGGGGGSGGGGAHTTRAARR